MRRSPAADRLRRIGRSPAADQLRRSLDAVRRLADSERRDSVRRSADSERRGDIRPSADSTRRGAGRSVDSVRRGVDWIRGLEDDDWARVGLGNPVTRRRLLRAVPGAAGAVLLGGAAVAETPAPPPPRAVAKPRAVRHPVESATRPASVVQRRPVYTLAEYRRVAPGPAFPADAVALTIDDGPHPVWTPKILDLLEKYHVPATFCMIGNQVLGHETVARSVVRAGHQLANHTWSHPTTLAEKPGAAVGKEIHRTQEKIHDTTGFTPKLFRSPGGEWSPTVLAETAKSGLLPLDWSDDPRDWAKPGTTAITRRLLACRPGQILLCHDGGGDRSQTYAALRKVIPALSARGYRFVAL